MQEPTHIDHLGSLDHRDQSKNPDQQKHTDRGIPPDEQHARSRFGQRTCTRPQTTQRPNEANEDRSQADHHGQHGVEHDRILAHIADQTEGISGALRALARHDCCAALDLASKLNTESRRDKAFRTVAEIVAAQKHTSAKENALQTALEKIVSAKVKSEAILAKDIAQLENARAELSRYEELIKRDYVTRQEYDQIHANAEALEATVKASRALVENARLQLKYCFIYSPISGKTGNLLEHEGNMIKANADNPIVVINQIQPIYMSFSAPEQHLSEIKKYMSGEKIKVEALVTKGTDHPEEGILTFIVPKLT